MVVDVALQFLCTAASTKELSNNLVVVVQQGLVHGSNELIVQHVQVTAN